MIQFPGTTPATRLCASCRHAYFGQNGIFCGQYREEIWNETVAQECEDYSE